MKRINMSVGEAVIRFLDAQYVKFDGKEEKFVESVYTLFGHGCVLGMGEALSMAKHGLKVLQGKNEQGMAQAALSYAKQNNRRKIIPCMSSIGPGAANMVTAAATATVNNVPLLLMPGDIFSTRRPDPVLQQVENFGDLTVSTNDAFKPVCRLFDRVYRAEQLETALINAMRVLTDPAQAGAVCIAMPQDVQGETYDFPADLFEKRVHLIRRQKATDDELKAANQMIKKAKKPAIIVGGGCRYSESGEVLKEIAKKTGIPLLETQAGKSVVPSSCKQNLGGLGVTGNLAANRIAAEADLIIALGTRFTDFTTSSKTLYADKKIITLNVNGFHAEKMRAYPVIGDITANAGAMFKGVKSVSGEWEAAVKSAKADWKKEMKRLTSIKYTEKLVPEVTNMVPAALKDFESATGAQLCQTTALGIVRKEIPKDAIVVAAAGSLPGDMQRMWTTDVPYTYNMEYGYSCMGYEIAGAFGSKMACPDKEVYALTGDGSYLMLHSELVTSIQEGKKINVLLFDNGGFGCINNLQMGNGVDSLATEIRFENRFDAPFVPIDFAKCAEGYGVKTFTARTEDELTDALRKAKEETRSVLIDIKVLPKTMTNGYERGFWQVGCTWAPRTEKQAAACAEQQKHTK